MAVNENQEMQEQLAGAFQDFVDESKPTDETTTNADVNPTEQTQTEPGQQNPASEQSKINASFAKMRTENSAMSAKLSKFEAAIKKQGYSSLDDYLAKQEAEELQKKAQSNNISPEVEKRIQALEEENARYRANERQARLNQEVGDLVSKYELDEAGWQSFVNQLVEKGIDPIRQNLPLEALYIQFNQDAIYEKRLAKAKQTWLAEQQGIQQKAPTPPPASAKPQTRTPGTPNANLKDIASRFKK